MELDKKNPQFPSDFISPQEKATPEFSLKWCEGMEAVGLMGAGNGFYRGETNGINNMVRWDEYAHGNQPVDFYKPILGITDKKTRKDPNALSFMAIDWSILDVGSKYTNVLIGKLIKQNNDVGVKAVDKRARDERREKKMDWQAYIMNKPFMESVSAQTGIQFEKPVQEDVMPLPNTIGELDVYMNMFYKEDYCLVMQDLLKLANEDDNYTEILAEVAHNLVVFAQAATKAYRVGNKVRRRNCDPRRMGMSSTLKSTCDDIKWMFEDWDITIGQFKEIAGDELTEAQYRDIAETATNSSFDGVDINRYFAENMCYPWDNTKITVKDAVWFSPDWETQQIKKNELGNVTIFQKAFEWWQDLMSKGVTEKSFNERNENKVVRYCLDNQYQALWVKGTKYVVKYGKSKDMLKNESSIGKTVGPFCVYKLKKSPIETIIPTLNNIQINWLQYQHHAAKSRPAGLDIEFSALQDISLDGAGGTRMKPKEVLRLYMETGIILWRRKAADGQNSNWRPINELQNGMSPAMKEHFMNILNDISLLRDQLGLNELTDASTPNSEMGKAVALMASGATDDALRPLFHGFDQINLGTHQRTVMTFSGMARTGLAPEYVEALGMQSMAVVGLLSDLTMHELGCYMIKEPSNEEKAMVNQYMLEGTKPGGWLYPEEALEIQNEPNTYRKVRLMKMYRQQKIQQAQADKAQDVQMNAQAQSQAAQDAANAAMAQAQQEHDQAKELAWETARAEAWKDKQLSTNKAFVLQMEYKLKNNLALSEEEQRRYTELLKTDRQGEWAIRKEQAKPKPVVKTGGK
jgi:hypothetical protein